MAIGHNIGRENIGIAGLFAALVLLTAWLQFSLLDPPDSAVAERADNDPDYYAENVVVTGLDAAGAKYRIIADRMTHYPVGDRLLLERPHIVQYELPGGTRHIRAESGWLYDNRSTVMLTGEVRVTQGPAGAAGSTATSENMVVHLKQNRD